MTTKTCTRCHQTLPVDNFHKRANSKDGRQSRCKPCTAEAGAEYRKASVVKRRDYDRAYYEKNRDKITARTAAWREANYDRVRERARAYYEENRDTIHAKDAAYYEANKERLQARSREYQRNLPREAVERRQERTRQLQKITRAQATGGRRRWTDDERQFVYDHPEMTAYQLAINLQRTLAAVENERRRQKKELTTA